MSVLRSLEAKIAGLVEGDVRPRLPVGGAPGRDRAQARPGDGRAQDRLGVAHLRAQRVRRLALARGPRALRGLRGRVARRARRPTCSSTPAASAWRWSAARRSRSTPTSACARRVRDPGAARARRRRRARGRAGRPRPHDGLLDRRARPAPLRRAAAPRRGRARCSLADGKRVRRRPGRRDASGAAASATSCSTTPTSRAATPRSGRPGDAWIVNDLGSTNGVQGQRPRGASTRRSRCSPATGSSSAPSTVVFELE